VNFTQLSGPPLDAIPPGVFDQTGGDLSVNGAHFGLCLVIFWERMPLRARIGEVVNSEKMVVFGGLNQRGRDGIFSFLIGSS